MTRQSTNRPLALVTLPDVAIPADSGRRLRSLSTLIGLSGRYRLDVVLPPSGDPERPSGQPAQVDVRRSLVLAPTERNTLDAMVAAVTHGLPWTLAHQRWTDARRTLARWTEAQQYDLVWFGSLSHSIGLRDVVTAPRVVVDLDDVQSVKWEGFLRQPRRPGVDRVERLQRRIELPLWRRIERARARDVDAAIVADPEDLARCAELGIANARAVPNSYPDPGPLRPAAPSSPPVVVFVGNYSHDPNRVAAEALVTSVLPALRANSPQTKVRLIGRNASVIQHLDRTVGVHVVGAVDDVADSVLDAMATLLPVTFGGGTRLKAMEAFALGVPVVSTAFGVAGLGAEDGVTYLRAETPTQFADRVAQLASDPGLRDRLRLAARRLYESAFTTSASSHAIDVLVGEFDD